MNQPVSIANPTARSVRARVPVVVAVVMPAVLLVACATARIESEWKSPDHAARSLKGASVLVMCTAGDESLRRICEDQWATRLSASGVKPLRAYEIAAFPAGEQATPDAVQRVARANGATTVASTKVVPTYYGAANSGTQVGVGVGGVGGSGGGISFGGIGISIPIGGGSSAPESIVSASTTLVEVASNALTWSANATAPGTQSIPDKVGALTEVLIEAMRKAGML